MTPSRRTTLTVTLVVWAFLLDISQSDNDVTDVTNPIVGKRHPPETQFHASGNYLRGEPCHAGALCVGPGGTYPIGRQHGVLFQSYFRVPSLPEEHDSTETTYYDYLNIYWNGPQPDGGYMNQIVPQLMLGNALANSTNHPNYEPQWIKLDTWHIGAQYFMGICPKNDNGTFDCREETWIGRAATGELIPVEPGEIVETTIELVQWKWRIQMKVVGEDGVSQQGRKSVVIAHRPYMGLVKSTKSWNESRYDNVTVGSCLENYDMKSAKNYPPFWQIAVNVLSPSIAFSAWRDWHLRAPNGCEWQPKSSISTASGPMFQHAEWNATLKEGKRSSKSMSTFS